MHTHIQIYACIYIYIYKCHMCIHLYIYIAHTCAPRYIHTCSLIYVHTCTLTNIHTDQIMAPSTRHTHPTYISHIHTDLLLAACGASTCDIYSMRVSCTRKFVTHAQKYISQILYTCITHAHMHTDLYVHHTCTQTYSSQHHKAKCAEYVCACV